MRKHTLGILVLGCFVIAACKKQEKVNPWVGVWKLDTSRSNLNEIPKQETLQIDAVDKSSIKYWIRGTSAAGKEYSESYDGRPDGGAYPVTANGRELGKIAYLCQSDRICTAQGKGAGGGMLKEIAALSDDGKTVVIKSREGNEEEETAVYTK